MNKTNKSFTILLIICIIFIGISIKEYNDIQKNKKIIDNKNETIEKIRNRNQAILDDKKGKLICVSYFEEQSFKSDIDDWNNITYPTETFNIDFKNKKIENKVNKYTKFESSYNTGDFDNNNIRFDRKIELKDASITDAYVIHRETGEFRVKSTIKATPKNGNKPISHNKYQKGYCYGAGKL